MKRIHDSLQRVFEQHRLVFWYDATGEWAETFDAFADESVTKLKVEGNEFGTKVRIVRDPNPAARFLVYVPTARPADADNWLLDLLLQGYEYKADKASLALQDVGLPHEFLHLAEEHAAFFRSEKRNQALKELIGKDDQSPRRAIEDDGRAGRHGGRGGCHVAALPERDGGFAFARSGGGVSGRGGAGGTVLARGGAGIRLRLRTRRRCGISPFRSFAAPIRWTTRYRCTRTPKSSCNAGRTARRTAIRSGSGRIKWRRSFTSSSALDGMNERAGLGDSDVFEIFEKFTLHRLCQSFEKGAAATDLRAVIQQRRTSFWQREHEHGYTALEHAVELRELLAAAELTMDSLATGVSRYVTSWWRIDMAYRRCVWNLRRYGKVQVMEPIAQWVEKAYVNNFLLPLADRWSDQVRRLEVWECPGLPAQRRFFENYVQPFRSKGQKVFVIISDALRYEAAMEFAQRLQSANRWTAEVDAVFGSLPTYTQLGMASLLPGRQLAVDGVTATVTVDGRSASGTDNRAEILRSACDAKAIAIQAEDFLELNTKTDGRALMRDHEVIYIFHNHIDNVGDTSRTEAKTFDAVEQAFDELELIIKKVANINGNNMLLTADHGFLFQQTEVDDSDMTPLPPSTSGLFATGGLPSAKALQPIRQ